MCDDDQDQADEMLALASILNGDDGLEGEQVASGEGQERLFNHSKLDNGQRMGTILSKVALGDEAVNVNVLIEK